MRAVVRSARTARWAVPASSLPALLGVALVASLLVGAALAAPEPAPGSVADSSVETVTELAAGAGSSGAAPTAQERPAPHPVDPVVRSYAVPGVSVAGLRTSSSRQIADSHSRVIGRHLAALSAPRRSTGFAVAGVTWTGRAPRGLDVQLRSRTGGTWSTWTSMKYDAEHGPTPGSAEARRARPGTDPFVVGAVDDVQILVRSDSGRAPAGLTLDVVDPGTSAADVDPTPITPTTTAPATARLVDTPATSTAGTTGPPNNAAVATRPPTPMPKIFSRADWGADERLRGCCVEYGEVHAGFVHHTVNANGYSRAEVPAILRGIYAYHTQSRGWRDIGYNFLIDRFGRIWEGRYGGVTLPVVGAHTLNYNENSFAASAIGNFQVARPSAAMIDAYARLYAWKLSLHGVRPTSTQNVAGTVFHAINGHRDAAQTACPGKYLYAKIPTIIGKAAAYQHLYLGRDMQHSFVRDSRPDLLMIGSGGAVTVARGTGPPGFAAPITASSPGFIGADLVSPVGDVTGDGIADVMARDSGTGRTSVHRGDVNGGFGPGARTVSTWASANLFAGVGDVTRDGTADVVARSSATGELRVYPGRGDGTFGRSRVAIADGSGFVLVTGAGDFDGDGFRDLLTRGTHGAVFVWFGDGTGAFTRSLEVAQNWSGRDVISGGVDLTGDGRPDVIARSASTHVVSTYANVGGHAFSPAIGHRVVRGRSLALTRDIGGAHRPFLVTVTRAGDLRTYAGSRENWLSRPRARSYSWPGTDKVLVVGDWDHDGYVDAMARRGSTGTMRLYRGNDHGGFEAPVGRWTGWGHRRNITPVGDFNGDGAPDLMAQGTNGAVYLYPGRRLRGFKPPVRMRSSLPSRSTIVSVGLWTRDGAPDVLVRDGNGRILLYPGNGPGGLDDPHVIATGYRAYRTLVGVGDLTGDGQADLLGRLASGQTWLIPGRPLSSRAPRGGLGPRQYLAANWSSYVLG